VGKLITEDVPSRANHGQVPGPKRRLPFPVLGTWHTYGLLWTREEITWYIDDVKITSARPFPSTWQSAQLILSASPGGVNGSASTVLPPITQVQWVRVRNARERSSNPQNRKQT
jgi:beta-glucanase (GH16 family)